MLKRNSRQISRILLRNLSLRPAPIQKQHHIASKVRRRQSSLVTLSSTAQSQDDVSAVSHTDQIPQRRISDPLKPLQDVHRSRSRSSLRSIDTRQSAKSGKAMSVKSESIVEDIFQPTSPTKSNASLTLVEPVVHTTRQRASTLTAIRSTHSAGDAPSIPLHAIQQRKAHQHHTTEHLSNKERLEREDYLRSLLVEARCVISIPNEEKLPRVALSTETKRPACDFDWDLDPIPLKQDPSTNLTIDIWVYQEPTGQISNGGKGKERAEAEWSCAISWTVDLSQLKPLGRQVSLRY